MYIFAVFEGILEQICQEVATNKLNLKVSDLSSKGGDLVRYKSYLEKVCNIDFSGDIKSSFDKIREQKIVRNKIVHHNGKIKSNGNIKIVQGMKVNYYRIDIYDKTYFDYLIESMEVFFEKLLLEIDKMALR